MPLPMLNEDSLSERPAIEQLKRLGWEYICGDQLDPDFKEDSERESRREVFLEGRLRRKLKEINPELADESVTKAIRKIMYIPTESLLEANQLFHTCLISGISVDQDIGARRQKVTVRFIDFANIENNEFLAVNQFWVSENCLQDRPDIVLFINGIPIGVIECKSPVAKDRGVADALHQLIRYQREIPRLFRTNELLIGCNLFRARYGPIEASPEQYHEWKALDGETLPNMAEHPSVREMLDLGMVEKGDLSPQAPMQEVLIAGLCKKRNLLDIIQNFVVFDFDKEKKKRVKKICRYQQYSAVNRVVKRVIEENEKRGIVWHWQGSGKSLIMLFAAVKLRREDERLRNPVILIVTDRVKLDAQIAETFQNCAFPNPVRAESKEELYRLLAQGTGCTITTTVQKFRERIAAPLSPAKNIIVMTDEAHRTQYGNFALNLRKALPNAALFAFTGTPLDKRARNTYRHFSPPAERYLDRYDMSQSIADGATVPVKYESRLAQLQIVGNSLDNLLKNLFPDVPPEELQALKRKYGTIGTVLSAPRRIECIARDIVSHFNQKIAPNGFKAMIIASERKTAVMYKEALDRLIDPVCSAVVMTVTNQDPEEWKEKYRLTPEEEDRITGKDAFQDSEDNLKFLIVCDKLLTGFDAPILQVLYLDQRLKEHTLLQSVARCNRPCRRKNFGLVVDYVGVGSELAAALAIFNERDLQGFLRVDDFRYELTALADCYRQIMEIFNKVQREKKPENIIQQCMEILRPEEMRARFDSLFREFARSMDILMPDPCVDPYINDFKFLGAVREAARNLYRDDRLSMDKCSKKIESLIHAHITDTGIEQVLAPLDIASPGFEEQLRSKGNNRAKASHVEQSLRQTISTKVAEDPQYYESLRQQLEQLITIDAQRRKDEAELLKGLIALKKKEEQREEEAKAKGLDLDELAFYGQFEACKPSFTANDEQRRKLAKGIVEVIQNCKVIDWIEKEDIQKEMRRKIKDLLRSAAFPSAELEAFTRELLDLARVRFKDS